MKKLFVTLSFLISLIYFTSQSLALPPCPKTGYKHNCYGSYTWENGNKYEGEWKDNKQYGQGNFTWKNGQKYVGEHKNNKRNGKGIYTYLSGGKYEGTYLNNKKNGQGVYTHPNGKIEDGEWKNGKLNGYAKVIYTNGDVNEGIWKDDKFLYPQKKPTPTSNSKIEKYKSFCSEIGFTPGTEKYGECVVEAMKKG